MLIYRPKNSRTQFDRDRRRSLTQTAAAGPLENRVPKSRHSFPPRSMIASRAGVFTTFWSGCRRA
jgi:hypothetical protein